MIIAHPIGNKIADRSHFQAMQPRKTEEVVHPRHCAVIFHNLADHARRIKPRQPRHIDCRFGMSRADKNATVARDQWKDVAGRDNIISALAGINRHRNCPRTIRRRNARRHAFARFDRRGERSLMPCSVRAAHQLETELVNARLRHGQTDQPAPVRRHEIDRVGRRHLRRDDQIAFILAILVIDQNIHPTIARFLDNFLDRHQCRAIVTGSKIRFELAQRFRRRVPVHVIKITQRIGMQPRRAGKTGPRHAATGDVGAEFFNKNCAHSLNE